MQESGSSVQENCASLGVHLQQVESIGGPIGLEQQGKPGYMKYAEPRRINEIANQNLTTNQKVGSSSLSGRATFFELTSSSKLNAMFFRAEPNDNGTDHKNGQGEKAHGAPIAHEMR